MPFNFKKKKKWLYRNYLKLSDDDDDDDDDCRMCASEVNLALSIKKKASPLQIIL